MLNSLTGKRTFKISPPRKKKKKLSKLMCLLGSQDLSLKLHCPIR